MTKQEYEQLQAELSKKLEKNPYTSIGSAKQKEGYKAGILAAKSILSAYYSRNNENQR